MSELEPDDTRVVHGNAKPEPGDERFAQKPEQAEQADGAPSREEGERGSQQEQSVDNDPQFEASDLDRGEAQYQADPLVQQQHQQNDWDKSATQGADFETGQADYGSAQARQELIDDAEEGDLSDDDIEDAVPEQARSASDTRDVND